MDPLFRNNDSSPRQLVSQLRRYCLHTDAEISDSVSDPTKGKYIAMAKTKRLANPQSTTTKLRLSMPRTQSRPEEVDSAEENAQSGSESPPSPPATKTPKLNAKRTIRKNVPTASSPASPAVTSSSATTPQPEQSSKRKGGNKRKFTHEYCLTCTRYGRACGGRREGEEGCAVCRDPDRSKGEKLRECLWADPEAGITDYKTARDVYKKAQAEARAQRAKPQSIKKQTSDSASSHPTAPRYPNATIHSSIPSPQHGFAAEQLPQTNKPLNLQPPITSGSGYVSQQQGYVRPSDISPINANSAQYATHPSVAGATEDQLPRIHRPQLTYVAIGSDGEEQATSMRQSSHLATASQNQQKSRSDDSSSIQAPYFDADLNSWVRPTPIIAPPQKAPQYYSYLYRSAYDAPPTPLPHPGQPRSPNYRLKPQGGDFTTRTPASPSSLSIDKSGSPPRKWSSKGSRITSIDGYQWRAKGWKPANTPKMGESGDVVGEVEAGEAAAADFSDTSSLSSCMSVDENSTTNTAALAQESKPTHPAATTSSAKLRLRFGNDNTHVQEKPSDQVANHMNHGTVPRPDTFTYPGEITIQEDEEAGTSSSDSELTSDEGKLKTLPSKIRKVLSRSRITKVIIEGDVFEIRPKNKIPRAKIHKKLPTARDMTRVGDKHHRQSRKHVTRASATDSEDGAVNDERDGTRAAGSQVGQTRDQPTPIKIKLIFKRKPAAASIEKSETGGISDAVGHVARGVSTRSDDNEMRDD